MEGVTPNLLTQTGTHLRCRPWLKRLFRSLSPVMSRPSCYDSWWPTLLVAATHPLLFTEAREPLEADHWLWVIESKFGLLHCTEVQKTLRRTTAAW
jgi:hypothetical protein